MPLKEIKDHVMFQTNNDADDVGDFEPSLEHYINDAYNRLIMAWGGQHLKYDDDDPLSNYPPLSEDDDEPDLPGWLHQYIADWATWLVYRNGNPQKQSRGYVYRNSFEDALAKIRNQGGLAGQTTDYKNFRNHLDP